MSSGFAGGQLPHRRHGTRSMSSPGVDRTIPPLSDTRLLDEIWTLHCYPWELLAGLNTPSLAPSTRSGTCSWQVDSLGITWIPGLVNSVGSRSIPTSWRGIEDPCPSCGSFSFPASRWGIISCLPPDISASSTSARVAKVIHLSLWCLVGITLVFRASFRH